MDYQIIKKQFMKQTIVINTPTGIDYRNDKELMELLTHHTRVRYTYPHPLEWLPSHITNINYCNDFIIDYDVKRVYLLDNPNNPNADNAIEEDIKKYSSNQELLQMMTKIKKIVCNADVPLDWLPDGITHLEIDNQMFNHPLENLPQSLIYLGICGGKPIYGERYFNQSLDNLPTGLKCLYLANLEAQLPLYNLPPTLEYLFIDQSKYTLSLDNLPNSIKKVIVITDEKTIGSDDPYGEIAIILDEIYKIDC